MAILKSGTSPDLLNVDPTAKSFSETEYDTNGNPIILKNYIGTFLMPISIRASAALTPPGILFILRNSFQTGYIVIKSINLNLAFDGIAGATKLSLSLKRIVNYQITSASSFVSVVRPVKLSNTFSGSKISECAVSPGSAAITVGVATLDNGSGINQPTGVSSSVGGETSTALSVNANVPLIILSMMNSRQTTSTTNYNITYDKNNGLVMKSAEALVLEHIVNTVAGDSINGFIEWDEYSS